jgi:hypothetical protein
MDDDGETVKGDIGIGLYSNFELLIRNYPNSIESESNNYTWIDSLDVEMTKKVNQNLTKVNIKPGRSHHIVTG